MIWMIQRTTRMPAMTKKALRASATMAWASRSLMLHFPHGAVRWPPGGVTRPPGVLVVMPRRLSTPCSQVNRIQDHVAALRAPVDRPRTTGQFVIMGSLLLHRRHSHYHGGLSGIVTEISPGSWKAG